MAFHGYAPEDIQYGRNCADYEASKVNDDATAAELAKISRNFYSDIYPGVGLRERHEVLRQVNSQALAQFAVAKELSLTADIKNYGVVATVTEQQLAIMTFAEQIPEFPQEQRELYNSLIQQA